MNQITTTAIVLGRTDYGEADRILTLLTPDQGKLRLIAKGVRRVKSKLAGGIELFSVSDIVYIRGRGEIGTLVSTRLLRHYGQIVDDIQRTMLGYELIKLLARVTEDAPERDYYDLLDATFAALNDPAVPEALVRVWFHAQLLRLSGHTPNLTHEQGGQRLRPEATYQFSYEDSAFVARPDAPFGAYEIKFLRLLFGESPPEALAKIAGIGKIVERVDRLVLSMHQQHS